MTTVEPPQPTRTRSANFRVSRGNEREHAAPAQPAFNELLDSDAVGPRDLRADAVRAANDDQQSIGQILQALQRRPARTSYLVAALFSGAWVVGCLALSWAYLSDLSAALGPGHSSGRAS